MSYGCEYDPTFKVLDERIEELEAENKRLKEELNRISSLLPDEKYSGSKDWRAGDTVDRVLWLLTMYDSTRDQIEELEDENKRLLKENEELCEDLGIPWEKQE